MTVGGWPRTIAAGRQHRTGDGDAASPRRRTPSERIPMSHAHAARALRDVETDEVVHVAFPKVRRHRQPFTLLFGDALRALLVTEGRGHEDDQPMRPVD